METTNQNWYNEQTGGGCDCLRLDMGKKFALLTAVDEPCQPVDGEPCVLGFYLMEQDHSEPLIQFQCANTHAAKAIVAQYLPY